MAQTKVYFNWSTGKDSAMALHRLLQDKRYTVDQLVTTVNSGYNRVTMHGLHRSLLEAQIAAIGIPSSTIELPRQPGMADYNRIMHQAVQALKNQGYTHAAFGDIFLEDLRKYRESHLDQLNISAVFPLWKKDTGILMQYFLDEGFKAVVVCAKAEFFGADFAGQELTGSLIRELPPQVDPCGENGEFHTFCYDGPIFRHPVAFKPGKKVYREYDAPEKQQNQCDATPAPKMGFWYADLTLN